MKMQSTKSAERKTQTKIILQQENVNLQLRKTSIKLNSRCTSKCEYDFKQHYMSTQHLLSPKKHNQQPKNETLQKSVSSKLFKGTSQREIETSQAIKEGDMYKKISPQISFQNNKISVKFVKELNKYTKLSQPKHKNQESQQKPTAQEVEKPKVFIKSAATQMSPLRSNIKKSRISQGVLSNHSELLSSIMRMSDRDRETLNTSHKGSLTKLLKLYH